VVLCKTDEILVLWYCTYPALLISLSIDDSGNLEETLSSKIDLIFLPITELAKLKARRKALRHKIKCLFFVVKLHLVFFPLRESSQFDPDLN
jgi:hypothetical protein